MCLRYKRPEHNLVASAEIGATNGTLKALHQKSGFRLGTGQYRNAVASGQTRPYNRAAFAGRSWFQSARSRYCYFAIAAPAMACCATS